MRLGGQRHASAALPPQRTLVVIVMEAGWAPRPVWTDTEKILGQQQLKQGHFNRRGF